MIVIPSYLIDADYPVYFSVIITPVGGSPVNVSDDVMMDGENRFNDEAGSSSFPIGCVISKYITFTIDNSTGAYDDFDFYEAQVEFGFDVDGTHISKGTYTITEPISVSDVIEITAIDKTYKLDRIYHPAVVFPATPNAIVTDICTQLGITYNITFAHTDAIITNIPDKATCRDVLGQVAAIECANARIDNTNVLRFLVWDFTRTDYTLDNFKSSPELSSNDIVITGITVVTGEDSPNGEYGDDGYKLIVNIPIIDTEEGNTISTAIAEYIGDILIDNPFRIMSGTYVPNVWVEFGDMAHSMDKNDNVYVTPITDFSFELFGDSLVATKSDNPIKAESHFNSSAQSAVKQVRTYVNSSLGKKITKFETQPVPPYNEGDIWYEGSTTYYCTTSKDENGTFEFADWTPVAVSQSALEEQLASSLARITGNSGGYLVLHDTNDDGIPDEWLIMDKPYVTEQDAIDHGGSISDVAQKIWRWNNAGLVYLQNGYFDNHPITAIDDQGHFSASVILTGSLDAQNVTIKNLVANMIKGGTLTLGGENNGDIAILDGDGNEIGRFNNQGLRIATENNGYISISVADGFVGYDANGNKIYWASADEFNMKKGVAEQEFNVGNEVRMIPITITENGTIINKGLAFVATSSIN